MPISTLSGGEKRRLQLLSVLITNPNILFLDEPTNDLDAENVNVFISKIEKIKENAVVIIISHDKRIVGIADKVIRI